jgi:hypothetical protein
LVGTAATMSYGQQLIGQCDKLAEMRAKLSWPNVSRPVCFLAKSCGAKPASSKYFLIRGQKKIKITFYEKNLK